MVCKGKRGGWAQTERVVSHLVGVKGLGAIFWILVGSEGRYAGSSLTQKALFFCGRANRVSVERQIRA